MYLFRGDSLNLKMALNHLEYVLTAGKDNTALINDKSELIEIYEYLIGTAHTLYEKHRSDIVSSRYYLRKELKSKYKRICNPI